METQDGPNITDFVRFLQLRDSRQITVNRHIRCIRLILSEIPELTVPSIKKYLEDQKIAGVSSSTLNNYISTIRLYARAINADPELYTYPLFKRKRSLIRKTFSDDQVEAFLAVPCRKWMLPQRHDMFTVFWALCAFCALRPGEASKLTKADIDIANKQIVLRPEITKTDQFSTLPLFPNIFPLVKDYVENLQTDFLFPSKNGGHDDAGQLCVIGSGEWMIDFNARLEQAGIEKTAGLVPYSFRHSAASRWIASDMNFYKVNRLMRHVKLEQTLVYTHMSSGHLVDSVVSHDPLVRKFADPSEVLDALRSSLEVFKIESDDRFSEEFKKGMMELFYEENKRLREGMKKRQ